MICKVDEVEWCMHRGSYTKNKYILHDIEYDDIVDILEVPSRINKMVDHNTSLLTNENIVSFEENKKYHIEWHCKCKDKYFMVMGWKVDHSSTIWIIYYADETNIVLDDIIAVFNH